MSWLALDIGGANLKVADGRDHVASRAFPLWRTPDALADAVEEMLAAAPPSERLAVTITGELADCFVTKAEGIDRILSAVERAARGRTISVYGTSGELLSCDKARARHMLVAASNWHALATFAARFAGGHPALLMDIGSTTTDLIAIEDGRVAAQGMTDPERLATGELVYTGVRRSPVCAVAASLPWRGRQCATAQELFATTLDAYLTLGDVPEDAADTVTADGRPATRECARDRLARCVCADRTIFDESDAREAAATIAKLQAAKIGVAAQGILRRMSAPPGATIVSGEGEFLARGVAERLRTKARVVSLADELGPHASRAAAAHALAVLARERTPT